MSRWGSNATWLELRACILCRKGAKSARHVALAGSEVVLGVQRDVAAGVSLDFVQKRGQKWEPRRIGGGRSRVGNPTRRGAEPPAPFPTQKDRAAIQTCAIMNG